MYNYEISFILVYGYRMYPIQTKVKADDKKSAFSKAAKNAKAQYFPDAKMENLRFNSIYIKEVPY